jgi:hypothetical protein
MLLLWIVNEVKTPMGRRLLRRCTGAENYGLLYFEVAKNSSDMIAYRLLILIFLLVNFILCAPQKITQLTRRLSGQ